LREEECTEFLLFNVINDKYIDAVRTLSHHSAIQADGFKSLTEGERVSFEIIVEQKGPAADRVIKL
jgi:hypothetical protein